MDLVQARLDELLRRLESQESLPSVSSRCLEEGCGKNVLDVCVNTSYEASRWLELKRAMCQILRTQYAVELAAAWILWLRDEYGSFEKSLMVDVC